MLACGSATPTVTSSSPGLIKPDAHSSLVTHKRLDGGQITGDEDLILECLGGGSCESICISQAFPQYHRFSLYMTNYENGDRCAYYLFGYDKQDGSIPYLAYYQGVYTRIRSGGALEGRCLQTNLDHPDFEGGYKINDERRSSNLLWLNPSGSVFRSYRLSTFQELIFTYLNLDFNDEQTFFLREGCLKKSEIDQSFIEAESI